MQQQQDGMAGSGISNDNNDNINNNKKINSGA